MSVVRRTLGFCLLVALGSGCRAQGTGSPLPAPLTPNLTRRIEVQVRSQFDVPPEVLLSIGAPAKSEFPGYENLPITFTGKGRPATVNFLLSDDGNTIARLEKFDISHDPEQMITTQGRPVRGSPAAKVTVVNFDDLECPYCAEMHAELFPATAARYQGMVKFIYKDYPLVQIHPWAMHAAVDANCLASQSGAAYWNFVDYSHAHAQEITGQNKNLQQSFAALDQEANAEAQRSKLDQTKLNSCIHDQDETAVKASMKQGDALGVNGTPTMFVNGERITGVVPEQTLWIAIDRALRASGVTPPPAAAQTAGSQTAGMPGK